MYARGGEVPTYRSNVVKVLHWGDDPAKIVCLIGSLKFQSDFQSAARALSLKGCIVLAPHVYLNGNSVGIDLEEQELLHEMSLKRIDMADRVLVINPNNRIPESVRDQIEYAESLGKIISYLETPSGK